MLVPRFNFFLCPVFKAAVSSWCQALRELAGLGTDEKRSYMVMRSAFGYGSEEALEVLAADGQGLPRILFGRGPTGLQSIILKI